MAFAQLTYRDGLRDIESCLQAVGGKLYRRWRKDVEHSERLPWILNARRAFKIRDPRLKREAPF